MNYATSIDCNALVLGNALDAARSSPDCSKQFIDTFINMAKAALADGFVYIHSPLVNLTKQRIVRKALTYPGCWATLAYTHSSYTNDKLPTSKDRASVTRAYGFARALLPDPLVLHKHQVYGKDFPLPDTVNYDIYRHNAIPDDFGESTFTGEQV